MKENYTYLILVDDEAVYTDSIKVLEMFERVKDTLEEDHVDAVADKKILKEHGLYEINIQRLCQCENCGNISHYFDDPADDCPVCGLTDRVFL